MKPVVITLLILVSAILSFAQIDSNYSSESNYKVNKFGKLESNVQPKMPAGFDAFGKSLNTKLDSAYIYDIDGEYLVYYNYNSTGRITHRKTASFWSTYSYDSAITLYSYNSFGLIEYTKQLLWNGSTGNVDSSKVYYEYNQDSSLKRKIEFENRLNIFDTSEVYEYTYDISGNLVSSKFYITYLFDTVLVENESYIYFINNNVLDSSYYFYRPYGSNNISLIDKYYFYYNTLNQLFEKHIKGLTDYRSSGKTEYSYDYNNMLINDINFTNYNIAGIDTLIEHEKTDYTYDSGLNNIRKVRYFANNFDSTLSFTWEVRSVDSLWVYANSLVADLSYPFNLTDMFYYKNHPFSLFGKNTPIKYSRYVRGPADNLVKNNKILFYNSNLNAGINNQPQEQIEVEISPNPFKESFRIKSDKFTNGTFVNIYNIVGELIKSEMINSNEELINLPNIASGVYFIRILDKNNSVLANKKVIKL